MTEVAADPTTYQLFIAGRSGGRRRGCDVRERQPGRHPGRRRAVPGGNPADVAMAVRAADMASADVEGDPGPEARRDPVPLRGAHGLSTRSAWRGR